ncbi:hemolysin family protein [Myxosarcina sp. GI1]|uniref:hemolysin family protein n=1 Tax=Myxosarcina sp. GI1 TaxID=1541065 RepID=UPI00056B6424|nr:hemolysin family protein [Myxosarcina sp. GI1]
MVERNFFLTFFGVFLLIAINAFFVTAEFSIVSVRRSRISQLVKDGDIQAQTVQSLQRSIERLLSTTQLGITLSSLALGWVGEKTMAVSIASAIRSLALPIGLSEALAHSFAVPISFLLLTYLQIVLGELCPKSVALLYPEQLARFFGAPSIVIARIFSPFIAILNWSTRWFLRLVGIEYSGQGWYHQVTSEELQLIIATERESTGLEAQERQIIKNVFEFREDTAVKIMIPRPDIKFLTVDTTISELLHTVASQGYSRYPVIDGSLDDIRGVVDYKNIAAALAKGRWLDRSTIKSWVEPVSFIPESTSLYELLPLMQRSQQKMIVVVDEFGGTSGLITLQDLIDEIIGDVGNSATTLTGSPIKVDENTYIVPAQMNLEEVNEQLELDLPLAEEYNTLGGFLLYQWQKIPVQGEKLNYDNLDFIVTAAKDNRLDRITVRRNN